MPNQFQYSTDTVKVGPYEFDCATLNAFIRRAWSVWDNPNVTYKLENTAFGDPSKESITDPMALDCSGFAWFSTYRKRLGYIWDGDKTSGWKKNWVEIPYPIAGSVVRYSPYPGNEHGHVGVVVEADANNFKTLDSSSSAQPPRRGSIKFTEDGKSKWMKAPEVKFVVSTQALKSVNGVPYKPDLNVYLAAAKRPVATLFVAVAAAIAVISLTSILIQGRRNESV